MEISVITVCYNSAATLRDTLDSVRAQSWRNIEYVVVDGGSTDGTLDILREYPDVVTRLVSERDGGIYDAMNKGVGLANGDVLYFLNSDDRFVDGDVLQDVAQAFAAHPETDLLYGNVIYWNEAGSSQRRFDWLTRSNLVYADLCHQVTFARRTLFDRVGGFDLQYRINADYDWLLRVFADGAGLRYIDRDIARFNLGGRHAADPDRVRRERRQVQLVYKSPMAFALGYTWFRALRKVTGKAA